MQCEGQTYCKDNILQYSTALAEPGKLGKYFQKVNECPRLFHEFLTLFQKNP